MKKTNSEPLQEAKTTAAAVCEEKPNAGGPSRTNPLTRTIAVVIFAICILSLELPWLLNHPSGLKLSLLLATAISGGLLFGFGLTMPDEHKKDQDSGEDNDINGWPLAGLYLILSISVGLIYYYCPGMRISGWLYVLINLGEALIAGLFGGFFYELSAIVGKAARPLVILPGIAAAAGAVYLGWPLLQNLSSPVLTLLLPGIILCGSVLVGMIGILVFLPEVFIGITRGLKQGIQKGRKVN